MRLIPDLNGRKEQSSGKESGHLGRLCDEIRGTEGGPKGLYNTVI